MTSPHEKSVYLDSNVFIYAIEGAAELADPLGHLLGALHRSGSRAVTSELTLAEVLAKANAEQTKAYLELIVDSGVIDVRSVSREILIRTASYRQAAGMMKLADAIHVVTAIDADCAIIISADLRLRVPGTMALIDADPISLMSLIQELS
jgi:predicted nucleic acid-binding protein